MLSYLSTQFLQVPVTSDVPDPSGYTVRMAFLPDGQQPTNTDWHPATWINSTTGWRAQFLVGPNGGAVTAQPGMWRPWVRITAAPEDIIESTGPIQVT
ncbi:hypothetical protein [Streptomyces sp. NPDC001404]|uniref:hypothetical protein n=1 Tax=Streptomyces sp. NPDC001404 TaxID=3364571 RepID=UPI0036794F0B